MANLEESSVYHGLVKTGHKESFMEALANFQAIEDLLKACIKTSDYILNKSSHSHLTYSPNRDNLDKAGLGTLANIFKALTKNKELCNQITKLSKERNLLAHEELLSTLKLKFTVEEIHSLQHRTVDITELASSTSKLYLQLSDEYQTLLRIKAEVKKA